MVSVSIGRRGMMLTLMVAVGCPPGGATSSGDASSSGDGATTGTVPPTTGGTSAEETSTTPGSTGDTEDTGDTGEPPPEPSGNEIIDQNALFTCKGEPALPPADVRLLDRYEWTRNVGSWGGSDLAQNPLYARAEHRYTSYSDNEVLDPSVLSLYMVTVPGAGLGWTKPNGSGASLRTVLEDPELDCFEKEEAPDAACVRYFVRRYLERGSLYRVADEEQVDALQAFADAALAAEAGIADRKATIMQIASAAWMSAGALHRSEVGEGEPDEHGRLRLGDWELAQAITYALTRTPPAVPSVYRSSQATWSKGDVDGDLGGFLAAAADGSIKDPLVVAKLVREVVGGLDEERRDLVVEEGYPGLWGNRGEYWLAPGIRDFFREWLDYNHLLSQPPKVEVAATSHWEGFWVEASYQTLYKPNNLSIRENTLVEHLDDMIARILEPDQDVFAALLTSRMFYTPATADYQDMYYAAELSRVYNVQGITEHTREARWKELPPTERAGVLTHPAWLAAHSLAFENDPNPVHRGKWIREELLCGLIPPLPLDVDASLPEASKDKSTRERLVERIDSDPYCNGCHQYMNPLGYPFEIYNHAGFVRKEDHGGPPDGSSTLVNMPSPELDGPVTSAIDLSARLAASPYAKRCFMRQTFRYFAGREETMRDACTMAAMEKAYDESGGSFTELLIALFNSDSFQYRVPN